LDNPVETFFTKYLSDFIGVIGGKSEIGVKDKIKRSLIIYVKTKVDNLHHLTRHYLLLFELFPHFNVVI
jgi:hypothetical protein